MSVGVYTKPSYDWLSHTFLLNIYLIDNPFLFSYIGFSYLVLSQFAQFQEKATNWQEVGDSQFAFWPLTWLDRFHVKM